jgi:FkbM family methyltransferase
MASSTDPLATLLRASRLTHVVDIGANPVDGAPPYQPLMDLGLCAVTGFEPQSAALETLRRANRPNTSYLPYAIGDGREHILHVCNYSGWTSIYAPSSAALDVFSFFKDNARVIERLPIQTHRLDDLDEVKDVDFLKIDIQGGELSALVHGRMKLGSAVAVQTEMQFVNLYEGQPSYWEIDQELRSQGFIPHAFQQLKKWPIGPLIFGNNPTLPLNQILEADVVYVRDFVRSDGVSDEQLKHLAVVAHHCYKSFDLAGRCVAILERRGALGFGSLQRYISILQNNR